MNFKTPSFKKVQVGKEQEKTQSEKDSHSKNRGGKKTKKYKKGLKANFTTIDTMQTTDFCLIYSTYPFHLLFINDVDHVTHELGFWRYKFYPQKKKTSTCCHVVENAIISGFTYLTSMDFQKNKRRIEFCKHSLFFHSGMLQAFKLSAMFQKIPLRNVSVSPRKNVKLKNLGFLFLDDKRLFPNDVLFCLFFSLF